MRSVWSTHGPDAGPGCRWRWRIDGCGITAPAPRNARHAESVQDLGEHFGAGLYRAEVDYLIRHEWARSAEDILWRRTKTGTAPGRLRASDRLQQVVEDVVREYRLSETDSRGNEA